MSKRNKKYSKGDLVRIIACNSSHNRGYENQHRMKFMQGETAEIMGGGPTKYWAKVVITNKLKQTWEEYVDLWSDEIEMAFPA